MAGQPGTNVTVSQVGAHVTLTYNGPALSGSGSGNQVEFVYTGTNLGDPSFGGSGYPYYESAQLPVYFNGVLCNQG